VDSLQLRPECGRAMAVVVGGEHWQTRAVNSSAVCVRLEGRNVQLKAIQLLNENLFETVHLENLLQT
jgi:hypothetical protein